MLVPRTLTLFLSVLCLLAATEVRGQATLAGTVVDGAGAPLPFATITVLAGGTDEMLTYATTGNDGTFSFRIDTIQPLDLVTRYLGKTTDSLRLAVPYPSTPLKIALQASSAELPRIEVTTSRRPVAVQNDTTRYSMSAFRDSLDRSVEDVLKKIPGIDVKEDGSIEVNGKAIKTILVEDTDLFGMDYQLGSKNIRARDIATVETIDHYQEDAVLRDVNLSDEIVLNLKLREDKRSIVAGELVASLGPGRGARYQLYTPLYRISRKRKTFLLLNADNLASDQGLAPPDGILIGNQESIRSSLFSETGFHRRAGVNNVGLPAIFTDNSKTLNGQLREHYTLGKSTLFLTLGGVNRKTSQQSSFRRQFLGTTAEYDIASSTSWQRKLGELNGQAEYNYTSPGKNFSLRAFAERKRETPSFQRLATGSTAAADTLHNRTDHQLYRAIATGRLSQGTVVQLNMAYQRVRIAERSVFQQADLPTLFSGLPDSLLTQRINYERERFNAEAVLLRKIGKLTLRAGLFAGQDENRFTNDVSGETTPTSAGLRDYGPLAQAMFAKGKWLHRGKFTYYANREGLSRHHVSVSSEKRISPVEVLKIEFSQGRKLPDLKLLLDGATYLQGPFDYLLAPQATAREQAYSLGVSRRYRNDQRLTSGFLSAYAERTTNGVTDAVAFSGDLTLTRPVAGADGYSAGLAGGYSFFSLALKSDVKTRVSANYYDRQYLAGNEAVRFQSLSYNFSGEISWLLHRRWRLRTDVQTAYFSSVGGVRFNNLSGRAATQLIFTPKGGRCYLGLYTAGNTGARAKNGLVNGYVGGQKNFSVGEREFTLSGRWYNPLDRRLLTSQSSGELYLNESSVGTNGTFAYLTLSMGL